MRKDFLIIRHNFDEFKTVADVTWDEMAAVKIYLFGVKYFKICRWISKNFMKKCAKCGQIYNNDLNFCLNDGQPLLPVNNKETPLISPILPNYDRAGAADKSKRLIGLLASILILGIMSLVIFAAFIYFGKSSLEAKNTGLSSNSNKVEENVNTRRQTGSENNKNPAALDEIVRKLNSTVINFSPASWSLSADAQSALQEAAGNFKNLPEGTVIEIGVHTDNSGNPAASQKLTQERADIIRNELIKNGVSSHMLIARGYGDTRPKAQTRPTMAGGSTIA